MFYSTDLLGRKSPLGAIWIAAHGKKLAKNSVLNINISETCNKIMEPDVPHALRLQGILIGGLVIIFHRQQTYLLDDCNDIMRKVRSATAQDEERLLHLRRKSARADAITLPSDAFMDFEDALPAGNLLAGLGGGLPPFQELGGEELFLVLDEPEPSAGKLFGLGVGAGPPPPPAPLPRAAPRLLLPDDGADAMEAALQMDKPEQFDIPGGDFPDVQPLEPDGWPRLDGTPNAPPPPLPLPAEGLAATPEPPAEGSPPGGAGDGARAPPKPEAALGAEGGPKSRASGEAGGTIAHARKRRRTHAGLKQVENVATDEASDMLLDRKVFREWLQDRSDILTERPGKAPRSAIQRPALDTALAQPRLLCMAGGAAGPGALPAPLDALLVARLVAARVPGAAARPPCGRVTAAAAAGGAPKDPVEGWLGKHTEGPQIELEPVPPLADIGPPNSHGMSMERLRTALSTPGSSADRRLLLQAGLSPGSNPAGLSSERGGPQTGQRPPLRPSSSDAGLQCGPQQGLLGPEGGRLSDVLEDAGLPGEGLEGPLQDFLGPEPPAPGHTPGLLTQFQAAGGSLLEETADPSALSAQDAANPHTAKLIDVLLRKIAAAEAKGAADAALSVNELTAAMSRTEAAAVFYHLCAANATGRIQLAQAAPYGDILVRRGALSQAATLSPSSRAGPSSGCGREPLGQSSSGRTKASSPTPPPSTGTDPSP